ncbi:hypothetical protein D918_08402 [Trichuris suis]|nr:hypothetical protein D918_08402 [Trichuris suis]
MRQNFLASCFKHAIPYWHKKCLQNALAFRFGGSSRLASSVKHSNFGAYFIQNATACGNISDAIYEMCCHVVYTTDAVQLIDLWINAPKHAGEQTAEQIIEICWNRFQVVFVMVSFDQFRTS